MTLFPVQGHPWPYNEYYNLQPSRFLKRRIVESVIHAILHFLGTGFIFGIVVPDKILNRKPFDATSISATVTS